MYPAVLRLESKHNTYFGLSSRFEVCLLWAIQGFSGRVKVYRVHSCEGHHSSPSYELLSKLLKGLGFM